MKTRNGFVSNSSSSSFIVAFEEVPKTARQMQDMLFDEDRDKLYNDYPMGYAPVFWTTYDVARVILENIKAPVNMDAIVAIIHSGYMDGAPTYGDYVKWKDDMEARDKNFEKYEQAHLEFARAKAQEFVQQNPNAKFYIFEIGDSHGEIQGTMGGSMEHGNVFEKLPHLQVSHH